MNYIILYYFLAMSIVSFIMFVVDKYKSMHQKWRIPEKNLIISALIGGSFGSLIAMLLVRHKIRKPKFYILVPLFVVLHIAILVLGVIYGFIQIPFI